MTNVGTKRNINLVSDTTFKYLLKNDRIKKWLYEIIKSKTEIDLTDYKLVDNELNTGNNIKDYRMDIVFQLGDTKILIEMNNGNRVSQTIKGYQYLYRMESRDFFEGNDYRKKHTKLIMFNNFCNKDDSNLKFVNYIFSDNKNALVNDDIESFEIYLPNYKKMSYNKCNQMEKRLYLFGCIDVSEMKNVVTDASDENQIIVRELERLKMDEQFLAAYDNEIVQKHMMQIERDDGYNEGFDKGFNSGQKEKNIEIIKDSFANGLTIEMISKITKLPINEVNKIIANTK